MIPAKKLIRRVFRFDLDAYLLFSEFLDDEWSTTYANSRPAGVEVEFIHISEPAKNERLINLCLEGKHFGGREDLIREQLRLNQMRNDECVVAKCGSEYVAMSWVIAGNRHKWPAFARVPLKHSRFGLLHKTYVKPQFRGHYLQRFLDIHRKKLLLEKGIRESLVCIGVKNFASVKNAMQCNDYYCLAYHLSIDIPVFGKCNLFPKWQQEKWISCRGHGARWSPEKQVVIERRQHRKEFD